VAAAFAIIIAFGISPAPESPFLRALGAPPSYGPSMISTVPNLAAIDRLIWMPGLDNGWDPQGLAVVGNAILVSAYRSDKVWPNRGPCRVFRVDTENGVETGYFDVPAPCGHAGGLAYAGAGELFIADTHTLFEIDLDRAFSGPAPKFRTFPLGRGLSGAFAVSGDGDFWIGDYRELGAGKAYRYDIGTVPRLKDGATLQSAAAVAVMPVPTYAQGGAIDHSGKFWVSRSDIGWGFLDRFNAVTGQLEQHYEICAGIEGVAFDRAGRLWAVSEDGARHFPWHYPFFPLIFRLDPARLAAAP
jgi:sugar lactone lactonase YvrE